MKKIVFGNPVWIEKVDPLLYDKQELISVINYNYNKAPTRNNWKGDNLSSLHHMYDDWDNKEFIKPDFESLRPIYEKHVSNFFRETNVKPCEYSIDIVNYTVINKDQYMSAHEHIADNTFAFVHYISFDRESHYPLVFHNDFIGRKFIKNNNFADKFEKNNENFMIFLEKWAPYFNEDDIIIFPAWLSHSVENLFNINKNTDKNRICIVGNVTVY